MLVFNFTDNLSFKWVTYTTGGQIYSMGSHYPINITRYFDLDSGVVGETSADIWLEKAGDVERYLVPQNGAILAIYYGDSTAGPIPSMTGIQIIEDTIPRGRPSGEYLSFEKYMIPGARVTGSVQINSASGETNPNWYFQIVDPDGDIERSWLVHPLVNPGPTLDFDHQILKTGYYQIRIININLYELLLYMQIEPYGWEFYESGNGQIPWQIEK